jgi:hypothetical protein
MVAKVLTYTLTGYANLAALKVAIDAWLVSGFVVIDVHVNDAGTECIIFYYA